MSAPDSVCDSSNEEIVGLRGRAKMITFIKRDGTRFAASYAHLHGVHLIAGGLRLEYTRYAVVVQGEHLAPIHHAISDHRVSFLRESATEHPGDDGNEKAHIRKIILTGLSVS
jgi:hypothetical protein